MKLTASQLREQDYWLSWWPPPSPVTQEQREEFASYDTHGGPKPVDNPIYIGKQWHGRMGEMYKESYFAGDGSWEGGLYLLLNLLQQHGPLAIRSLEEWFPSRTLDWLEAAETDLWNTKLFDLTSLTNRPALSSS